MWPSPEKIPEALCLPTVQVDTVHFSPEATETNGFSRVSFSLNRTAVNDRICRAYRLCHFPERPRQRHSRSPGKTSRHASLLGTCRFRLFSCSVNDELDRRFRQLGRL